jgi:hypothetical protein
MTEDNIQTLIGFAYLLGIFYLVFNYMGKSIANNNSKVATTVEVNSSPQQKSFWDKLKIASTAVAAIAALVYAVFKIIELFIGKK